MATEKDPRTELEVAEPFVSLFPVQPEVLALVKDSIKEHGFLIDKPILVWRDAFGDKGRLVVVDGNTRLQAALDLKVPKVWVTPRQFKDLDAAITAGIGEQVQRRNLNREQIAAFVVSILPMLDEKRGGLRTKTGKQLAEMLGVSEITVKRARVLLESGQTELIAKVKDGEMSLLSAYTESTGGKPPAKTATIARPPATKQQPTVSELQEEARRAAAAAAHAAVKAAGKEDDPETKKRLRAAADFDRLSSWVSPEIEEAGDIEPVSYQLAYKPLLQRMTEIAEEIDRLGATDETKNWGERRNQIHALVEIIDKAEAMLDKLSVGVTVNANGHKGSFRIAQIQFHPSGAVYALNRTKAKIDVRDITKIVKLPADSADRRNDDA